MCATVRRYDPVATGVGSLLVTGYCVVVHQQPVEEALNIAAGATILGMVSSTALLLLTVRVASLL